MNARQRLLVLGVVAALLAAVGGSVALARWTAPPPGGRLQVVVTFYPLAYWTEWIGGDHVAVETLIPPNLELHGWEPSTGDILAAEEADVFIYSGAGLEPWVVQDILPALNLEHTRVVAATAGLDLAPFDDLPPDEEGEGGRGVDPHTWVDPILAKAEAQNVLAALSQADLAHAGEYTANAQRLFHRLDALDAAYATGLAPRTHDTIIVAHEAFGYLGRRYGFDVHGIVGLSAEEQPSAADLGALVDAMIEEGLFALFLTPTFSVEYILSLQSTLELVTGETVNLYVLHLLTGPQGDLDYLDLMEANLDSLRAGLGATGGIP